MKIVKITLRQAGNGLFQVEKFSNTVQLSVGMTVESSRVAEWCAMARVQVDCIGMVQQADSELPLLDAAQPQSVSTPDTMAVIRAERERNAQKRPDNTLPLFVDCNAVESGRAIIAAELKFEA